VYLIGRRSILTLIGADGIWSLYFWNGYVLHECQLASQTVLTLSSVISWLKLELFTGLSELDGHLFPLALACCR
jgi:hypothetical protein